MRTVLSRLRPDPFLAALVAAVALASILPSRGAAASALGVLTPASICLLFFLHGAKLSREALQGGLTHWRLQLAVLTATFVMFPLLGLAARGLAAPWLGPELGAGLLFLCLLPSTVQSSIAFTSMAGGNVPAAICSASASNIFGMFLTPLLVGLLFSAGGHGTVTLDAVKQILLQLLAPFVIGQMLQPVIGNWIRARKGLLAPVDRGSILMVVYLAFSQAVTSGLWQTFSLTDLGVLVVIEIVMLALVIAVTMYGSRLLGFDKADEIAITFCGSKKSLASGVPMASAIFAGQNIGAIVLPVMLFHQIQLMACAVIAQHYAARKEPDAIAEPVRS